MNKQSKGSMLSFLGVTFYSMDSLLIALSGVSGFSAGFWRGLFTFISIGTVFFILNRNNLKNVFCGKWKYMLFSGLMLGLGGAVFAFSISYSGTSISLVMLSLNPILTAIFTALLLKEKPAKHTIVIMFICLIAVIYMFGEGLKMGNILSYLIALLVPIALALNLTNLRKYPELSRMGVSMIGGFVTAIASLIFSGGKIAVDEKALLYLGLLGLVIIPIGQVMITSGTKYAKASSISLINSLECVFGLFYVWLFIGTVPSVNCLIGGTVIMLSIIINIALDFKCKDSRLGCQIQQCG